MVTIHTAVCGWGIAVVVLPPNPSRKHLKSKNWHFAVLFIDLIIYDLKMAKKPGKIYLGYEEEIITEKNMTIVNYTVNKIGGLPVSLTICKYYYWYFGRPHLI